MRSARRQNRPRSNMLLPLLMNLSMLGEAEAAPTAVDTGAGSGRRRARPSRLVPIEVYLQTLEPEVLERKIEETEAAQVPAERTEVDRQLDILEAERALIERSIIFARQELAKLLAAETERRAEITAAVLLGQEYIAALGNAIVKLSEEQNRWAQI